MVSKICSTTRGPSPCEGSSSRRRSGELLAPVAEHREHGQHRLEARGPLRPRGAPVGAELEVFQHAERREDAPALRNVRDAERGALVRGERAHVPAPELETPRRAPDGARDRPEQCGLAGSIGADDRDELALTDLEGHLVEGAQAAVGDAEPRDLQHGRPVWEEACRASQRLPR